MERLIGRIRSELGREVFAGPAPTLEERQGACAAGATYVCDERSAGYTDETASRKRGGSTWSCFRRSWPRFPRPSLRKVASTRPSSWRRPSAKGLTRWWWAPTITNPREITKRFVQAVSWVNL